MRLRTVLLAGAAASAVYFCWPTPPASPKPCALLQSMLTAPALPLPASREALRNEAGRLLGELDAAAALVDKHGQQVFDSCVATR